jgi:hypothetical protein
MKTIIIVWLLFASSIQIISQQYDDININPMWEFYSFSYLNTESAGKGFTGIADKNNISGFLLNPASVSLPAKNQINFHLQNKSTLA